MDASDEFVHYQDGYVSDDGIYSVMQYDDLDLMCDDIEFQRLFTDMHNNQEVNILNRKFDGLNLNDLTALKDQRFGNQVASTNNANWAKQTIQDKSFNATLGFKQKLNMKFGRMLDAKLMDGICNIFDHYCKKFSNNCEQITESLVFDLLKLLDCANQEADSEVSDEKSNSTVSSQCEDIVQLTDDSEKLDYPETQFNTSDNGSESAEDFVRFMDITDSSYEDNELLSENNITKVHDIKTVQWLITSQSLLR
ncbi:hypothetical protein ACP70R_037583 [Stipagrostis hirtigluma subsp. patula]